MSKGKLASVWDNSNIISKCFLTYIHPLMRYGFEGRLSLSNLARKAPAPKADRSKEIGGKLERVYYNASLNGKTRTNFLLALLKTFWPQFLLIITLDLIAKCIGAPIQTILLGYLVKDFSQYLSLKSDIKQETTNSTTTTATTTQQQQQQIDNIKSIEVGELNLIHSSLINNALALIACTWLLDLAGHLFFLLAYRLAMRCRIAACYLIYRKSLRLSMIALAEHTTTGQMINLLSNDVNRFEDAVQMVPSLIGAPVQVATLLALMCQLYHGTQATLASFSIIFGFLIIQISLGFGFFKFRRMTAKRTDERVRLINEILQSIRMIKIYAWEKPFESLVSRIRRKELNIIAITSLLKALNQTLFFMASKVIVFVSLITFVYAGRKLNPEVVAATIFQANLIRMSLTFFFPYAIASCAELCVSCSRINKFLELPEVKRSDNISRSSNRSRLDKLRISMENVYASRSKLLLSKERGQVDLSRFPVRELNMEVKRGDLIIIVGRLGSGKSSVLLSMLGETSNEFGKIKINGRISYAPQEPWIFAGTVRDNITLGQFKKLRSAWYKRVLDACLLDIDIYDLPKGDRTKLDGSSSQLSRDQATRIGLARALYQDTDIYLLDSPLSALEPSVAGCIFNEAILKLLKKKTVVMATNQLQFLKYATKILVLDTKLAPVFGTFEQIKYSKAFTQLLESAHLSEIPKMDIIKREEARDHWHGPWVEDRRQIDSIESDLDRDEPTNRSKFDGPCKFGGKLENLENLSLNWRSYEFYMSKSSNWLGFIWFIVTNIVAQVLFQYTDLFLSFWTDSVQRMDRAGDKFKPTTFVDSLTVAQTSAIYAGCVLICTISALLRALTFYGGSLLASIRLHRDLIRSIIRSLVCFFDFRSMGMLLNRVSRDIGYVDDTLPTIMLDLLSTSLSIVGVLVLANVIDRVNIIPSVVYLISIWLIRSLCASTIIRLKQIEGIVRSPIFSQLSSTLAGLTSIRVFRLSRMLSIQFDQYQDTHTGAWFAFICSGRFQAMLLDIITLLFVTLVVGLKVGPTINEGIPSMIGIFLTQVFFLPARVQWGSRQLMELESQMTSVQRIEQFTNLDRETDQVGGSIEALILFDDNQIKIEFEHVSLDYMKRGEPQELIDLSFTIEAGERVGIVGASEAGKSSLISVLVRLYAYEGKIKLNGVDTRYMELKHLRSLVGVVPQEPVLFARSLRKNLDPFDEHSDFDIWSALDAVELIQQVESWPELLQYEIQESGSNLSVGQRQLICLARAILRRNKILILDEATANVDPGTDASIQKTIREQFSNSTVIIIAHRLSTIAVADRVLVLKRGRLCEFDKPTRLMRNKDSEFSRMLGCLEDQQADPLRRLIEEADKGTD